MMEHTEICKECGHFMKEHGVETEMLARGLYYQKGYCARGPDCKCTVKGQTYEQALEG